MVEWTIFTNMILIDIDLSCTILLHFNLRYENGINCLSYEDFFKNSTIVTTKIIYF